MPASEYKFNEHSMCQLQHTAQSNCLAATATTQIVYSSCVILRWSYRNSLNYCNFINIINYSFYNAEVIYNAEVNLFCVHSIKLVFRF